MHMRQAFRRVGFRCLCSLTLGLSAFGVLSPSVPALVPLASRLQPAAEYEVIILTAPAPLTDSVAEGTRAGQTVGTGRIAGSTYPDETHAVLWPSGSTVGIDLNPTNFRYSAALETDGQRQVGSGSGAATAYARHALLWNGSANSYTDLHPAGNWNDSIARAIAGTQQVGNINLYIQGQESSPIIIEHAALWAGTAASVVDLHPPLSGCERSYGNDTDGSHQVGQCYFNTPNTTAPYRALLWSGTAASAVVLHPAGYTHSFAEGVSGNEQVGYAFNSLQGDGLSRALLWHGSAGSVVNLHPAGYDSSSANATNGATQVGSGSAPAFLGQSHALRWSGTAASVLDLHLLLPAEFSEGGSIAFDIDAAGNIAGLAQRPDGTTTAVLWRKIGDTGGPTPTAVPTATPTPTPLVAEHTSFRSPTANGPNPGGDGNGYEANPAQANLHDGLFARDMNSGTGTGLLCTGNGKDKHQFWNYGFSLPSGAVINGIEVRLDAKADSPNASPKLCVQLSWDGGATWTLPATTAQLGTSVAIYRLGGSTNTWGRTWTTAEFANANFRLRVIDMAISNERDFMLDWVAVRVHFTR
jgi:hypothetical protein